MSEIWIVLTDDWELRGNGTGTVEHYQRTPALRLMDLYEELGIRSSFNLEVMQQIAFENYAEGHEEIRAGRDAWLDAVQAMVARGFDTQLHIHPQWWNAEFIGGWWKLGRRWDITVYRPEEVTQICDQAFAYIAPLIAPRVVETFRAGSWGMGPPSRTILTELMRRGVKVDVSIAAGLRYVGDGINLDYSKVESPYATYRPDIDDIRKVCRDGTTGIIEIPTQSVTRAELLTAMIANMGSSTNRVSLKGWLWSILPEKFRIKLVGMIRPIIPPRPANMPDFVMRDPFGLEKSDFGMVIDISGKLEAGIFNNMADIAIARARRRRGPSIKVLVFENHTKDLQSQADFDRIRKIIGHIRSKHPDVKFRTLHDVSQNLPAIV